MPGRDETLSLLATRKELITLACRMLELSSQESPPAEEPVETCTGPLSYEVGLLRSELAKGLDRLDALEKRFDHHQHYMASRSGMPWETSEQFNARLQAEGPVSP